MQRLMQSITTCTRLGRNDPGAAPVPHKRAHSSTHRGCMHVTSVRQVYYTYDNAQKMGHVPEKTKNVHCRKPRLLSPPRAFDFERFRVKFTR